MCATEAILPRFHEKGESKREAVCERRLIQNGILSNFRNRGCFQIEAIRKWGMDFGMLLTLSHVFSRESWKERTR